MTVLQALSGKQLGGSLKPRVVVLLLGVVSLLASNGAAPKGEYPSNDAASDEGDVSQYVGWSVFANEEIPPVRSSPCSEGDYC